MIFIEKLEDAVREMKAIADVLLKKSEIYRAAAVEQEREALGTYEGNNQTHIRAHNALMAVSEAYKGISKTIDEQSKVFDLCRS